MMLKESANKLPQNYQFNGVDIVKLICAIMVCIIHIQPFSTDVPAINKLNFWVQNFPCRIAVPFYFTASGFMLFRKTELNFLNVNRIKNYSFKILRLLGTWTFLLFVGGTAQLWYLGALVLAVIILSVLIKNDIPLRWIALISFILFLIGLLGDSYYGFIEPLKNLFSLCSLTARNGYEVIFRLQQH